MLIGVYAEKVCTPKLFTKGELRFNAVDWPGLKNWEQKAKLLQPEQQERILTYRKPNS